MERDRAYRRFQARLHPSSWAKKLIARRDWSLEDPSHYIHVTHKIQHDYQDTEIVERFCVYEKAPPNVEVFYIPRSCIRRKHEMLEVRYLRYVQSLESENSYALVRADYDVALRIGGGVIGSLEFFRYVPKRFERNARWAIRVPGASPEIQKYERAHHLDEDDKQPDTLVVHAQNTAFGRWNRWYNREPRRPNSRGWRQEIE